MAIVDPFDAPASGKGGIIDPFEQSKETTEQPRAWSDVPLEALKNFPSSAYGVAAGLGDVVKKVAPYAKYGPFAVQKIGEDIGTAIRDDPDLLKKVPAAVLKDLVDHYGSMEALKKTIATDPARFAVDAATIAQGGAAVVGRVRGAVGAVNDIAKAADVSGAFHDIALPPEPPPPQPGSPPPIPNETGDALARLKDKYGVELPRAVTSESQPVQAGSVALSKLPVVGAPLDKAVRAVPAKIGEGVERVAQQYSPELPQNIVGSGFKRSLTGAADTEAAAAPGSGGS